MPVRLAVRSLQEEMVNSDSFSICRVLPVANPESIATYSSAGSSTMPRRCRSLSSAPCACQDATSAGWVEPRSPCTVTLPCRCRVQDGIMDLRSRANRGGEVGEYRVGWCCRHQVRHSALRRAHSRG